MKKFYNKDGTVDIMFNKEELDNMLNKFINTQFIDVYIDKFNNNAIFLTTNKKEI